MSNLHLGFDSSTQSLSVAVVDLDEGKVVYQHALNFQADLPHYHTDNGVFRTDDPTVIHAPPLMWLEALDVVFQRMKDDGVPLGDIRAVSGSGQQHGSVYLNAGAEQAIASLDPARNLVENLAGIFSRATSPIWLDSSTSRQCEEITRAMASRGGIIAATGSAAIERFTGPQIRKFQQENPEAYGRTRTIALVSSFLCSVLSGKIAPIDPGDGAGMNLMDIRRRDWHPDALASTAPGLRDRLPPLAASGAMVGNISPYFSRRYGLNQQAVSVIWSGDNPCSVIGLGMVEPGMVAISMGTSYTYIGTMAECHVDHQGLGHVFGSPAGGYMTLNCFKNGGMARARLRDRFQLDWDGYRNAMETTPPGNHGRLMLPWFETEIVPKVLQPGAQRRNLPEEDVGGNCRALVEGQMMAMRLHAGWMMTDPSIIFATGGGSRDPAVLRVMADVFQCPVQPSTQSNSAATGAALIAAHAVAGNLSWPDLVKAFASPRDDQVIMPDAGTRDVYKSLLSHYAELERAVLDDPPIRPVSRAYFPGTTPLPTIQ